ncbi:Lrp/AsnC family transcriptional regulator [Pseudoponticoccus marisrubri]|uniref:AsnC family transcriptional regulator n=1 Tax=Pseudoponticoccus marisrubri TaxID=1685382 RepID=A0A0W7WNK3_9RHOB|nr:Lrp/AsnC family transcriptional regulator [Pseudoponticoccus marisrubri]KUF12072.1 AsnC family transcriptional regulator [Pseudoponticoccus marisrubri]
MQIDETDRALIALLSENARLPVTDLARRLGIARTTVQARIDRLVDRGVIAGFTLRRGPGLRPAMRATVLIAVEPRATPGVLDRLKALSEVEAVHTTSGRFDLIATLGADTTEQLDRALDQIGAAKGVQRSESLIHLSTRIDRGA